MNTFQKKTVVFVYIVSLFAVILLLALMDWPLGSGVILKIVTYIAAMAVVKLTIKAAYENQHFVFPKFLTCMHMQATSENLQAANFASEAGSDRTDDFGPTGKLVGDITVAMGLTKTSEHLHLRFTCIGCI